MTGEDLKKRREELGLSITEVSLVTKISLRVLHAIEAMDKAQLPAEIFLKGLLKSYALHLKLDAESTTKSYLLILNPPPPKPVEPAVDPAAPMNAAPEEKKEIVKEHATSVQTSPSAPNSMSKKTVWISAGVVVVLAVLIFVGRMMNHAENNVAVVEEKPIAKPVENKPIEVAAQPLTAEATDKPAEEAAKPVEHPMETNQAASSGLLPIIQASNQDKPVEHHNMVPPHPVPAQVPTPIPGTAVVQEEVKKEPAAVKPEPIKTETPAVAQTAKIEEKPKLEEKPKVEEKPADKPVEKVADAAAAVPTGPKSKELILEALDKVNIVIKKGSKQYKVSLQPDEIHTVHYSDTIEVEVSDGGAVNLIQNGHDNGVAGDLGKPKKMSL